MKLKYLASAVLILYFTSQISADKTVVKCEKNAPAHESFAKESIFPTGAQGHEMAQEKRAEKMRCSGVFSDLVEDLIFMHSDQINGNGVHRGSSTYRSESEENKVFNTFSGEHKVVFDTDGNFTASWQGKFTIMGGEGKFAQVKGSGHYSGTATTDSFSEKTKIDVEM